MPAPQLVNPITFPGHSGIANIYKSPQLADAFATRLPVDASNDPKVLAQFIFTNLPSWVRQLMGARDLIAGCFGLKTAAWLTAPASGANYDRIGIFRVYSANDAEIIMGEDDKHLDFRISVSCSHGPTPQSDRVLTVATVVNCHNRLGRATYLRLRPFTALL